MVSKASIDSSLLDLHVAAASFPNPSGLSTVQDEKSLPLIFCRNTSGRLLAIKENQTGAKTQVDLSAAFDKHQETTAFAAVQDRATSDIYLAFAQRDANGESTLNVIKPFSPSVLDVDSDGALENLDLKSLVIEQKNRTSAIRDIRELFMGPRPAGQSFPEILAAHTELENPQSAFELSRVVMNNDLTDYTIDPDFEIPEDATNVYGVAPAVTQIGRGFFMLYELQDQPRLVFSTTDKVGSTTFTVLLQAPPNARSLASFVEEDTGHTSLLVGGDGLWHWKSTEIFIANAPGRKVSQEDDFPGMQQMTLSENNGRLFVVGTSRNDVVYGAIDDPTFSSLVEEVPLVPEFGGGRYSPFVSSDGSINELLVAGGDGNLRMLSQSPESTGWSDVPFVLPDTSSLTQFRGYMSSIALTADDKPLLGAVVMLKSSDTCNVIVNGRNITCRPSGVLVVTDFMGMLTVLTPTKDDPTTHTFEITNPPSDAGYPQVLTSDIKIDPSEKSWTRLDTLTTVNGLKSATMPDGSPLVPAGLSNSEYSKLASAMKEVVNTRQSIVSGRARQSQNRGNGERILLMGYNAERIYELRDEKAQGRSALRFRRLRKFFKWVKETVKKAFAWVVEKVGDVIEFFLQIGDKVFELVIDTIEAVADFFVWLGKEILGNIRKLAEWLLELLGFGEIKKMKSNLQSLVGAAVQVAPSYLEAGAQKIDTFFEDMKTVIQDQLYPEGIMDMSSDVLAHQGLGPGKMSATANYFLYQVVHGGAGNMSTSGLPGVPSSLQSLLEDVVIPTIESLSSSLQTIGEDVRNIFDDTDNVSVGQAIQILGVDVLVSIVDLIKTVVTGLVNSMAEFVRDIGDFIDTPLHFPLLTSLYELVAGEQLTLIGAISFVFAAVIVPIWQISGFGAIPEISKFEAVAVLSANLDASLNGTAASLTDGDHARGEVRASDSMALTLTFFNFAARLFLTFIKPAFATSVIPSSPTILRDAQAAAPSSPAGQLRKFVSADPVSHQAKLVATTTGPPTGFPLPISSGDLTSRQWKMLELGGTLVAVVVTCPWWFGFPSGEDEHVKARNTFVRSSWIVKLGSWGLGMAILFAGPNPLLTPEVGAGKDVFMNTVSCLFAVVASVKDFTTPGVNNSLRAARLGLTLLDTAGGIMVPGGILFKSPDFIFYGSVLNGAGAAATFSQYSLAQEGQSFWITPSGP
ncbi:hypothetical protein DL764_000713 [Monosporascus ibericus]|uniref:Uncharacterized protein n=1 Tax=Monosporascus ibericus TaxID=155417 RepID=A0A4V1XCN6_9PEZI|nr:hypothetical protein DL764_000713 [Monosporascus ibericus]